MQGTTTFYFWAEDLRSLIEENPNSENIKIEITETEAIASPSSYSVLEGAAASEPARSCPTPCTGPRRGGI